MWKKIQSVIAFFCILVYIGSVGFAAYRIYNGIKSQHNEAAKEFDELVKFASGAGVVFGFLTQTYKDDIKDYLGMSRALEAVIIAGPDGNTFAVEKTGGIISYSGGFPRFDTQKRLYGEPQKTTLQINNYRGASISAIATIIDYNQLLYILRTSLLAILIAVIIAFFTFILDIYLVKDSGEDNPAVDDVVIDEKPAERTEYTEETPSGGFDIDFAETETETEDIPSADFDIDFDETEPAEIESAEIEPFLDTIDDTLPDDNSENEFADVEPFSEVEAVSTITETSTTETEDIPSADFDIDFDETEPAEIEPAEIEPFLDTIDDTLPDDNSENEFASVEPFSEADGFETIENQLQDELDETELPEKKRGLLATAGKLYQVDNFGKNDEPFERILEMELSNAIADNKDLSLLCAEWMQEGLSYQSLTDKALKFFKRGTRVFDKDGGGILIIIPDTDIEQGFHLAKEFHREVLLDDDGEKGLLLGLSCRSGRIVHADRLIQETERAWEKAREDSALPIVAFKVDTKKYNEFIEQN